MRKRVVVNQKEWLHNNIRRHDPISGRVIQLCCFQSDKRTRGALVYAAGSVIIDTELLRVGRLLLVL